MVTRAERLGTDDGPRDAAAVVDVDAQSVGERVGAADDDACDDDPGPFGVLPDLTGRDDSAPGSRRIEPNTMSASAIRSTRWW